jgi:hypothetical protein
MKKTVYTLALKGYPKEMTDLTFPWIRHWANKIGAKFSIIEDRKFPDWPATYEKHQIFELGRKDDWSIFIDADALINPDLFDFTETVYEDTVIYTGQDMAAMRFRPNKWTRRDKRFIGACTWFVACSRMCLDLWKPVDADLADAVDAPESEELVTKIRSGSFSQKDLKALASGEIFPTNAERNCRIGDGTTGILPEKLIEDYTTSNNIARFGLKHETIEGHIKQRYGRGDSFYYHQYTFEIDIKIVRCLTAMRAWGLITPDIEQKYGDLLKKVASEQANMEKARAMMMPQGLMGFPGMRG